MDQAALRRHSYNQGLAEGEERGEKKAEARYRPVIAEKDRAIEELRRKLREAGID
jgi:flagellar biosynthesis/type III secretory pathway protein FliH